MKLRVHMRIKILLLCLGSTLIALILQTLLFENTSARLILNQAREESFNSLQNMQNDIYSFVKDVESGLIKVYNQKDFIKGLRNQEKTESLKQEYYGIAYMLANENFTSADGVVALYVYSDEHEIISTYRRAMTPRHHYETDIYDAPQEQNAQVIREYAESDDADMLISSYYNQYRETDIIRFVLKIYNNSNLADKLGYLVCDIDTKVVRAIMKKYSIGQEMFMWLQPRGDRSITSIGTIGGDEKKDYEEVVKKIQSSSDNPASNISSSKRVFFQVPQNKYNLDAYSLMPQSLLAQNQTALKRNLLLIAGIMITAAIIVSMFISKSLTRPLEKLSSTIKRIRGGETDLRVEKGNQDEIGELGQNFNELLDEMNTLIRKEYETKLMLNKAEYRALQAQINPHFLYNTLDTMSSIAQIQNCTQVSGLSQSLANIFRYSLDMKNPFSTVAKEIVHLKNFIYVMNVRMMDGTGYRFEIDEQVMQDTLPRITIQPLVENALNHGLRNKRGDREIVVSARAVEEKLEICVEDNGVGISQERIAQILEEKLEKKENDRGNSIGVSNIRSRLLIFYGAESDMKIESEEGKGTKVILTIPRMKMEEVRTWM